MPMAGKYFGQMCLPRIGQEVVIQFLDGNIDRPIIVGVVYNRDNMPPWHLPAQRALAGLRSREFGNDNGGSNHLVLDDTNGKMQAQLRSDHQSSQLSLGSIHRIETSDGRLDARGEGWELATNAWGVARANRGLLLTTEPRPNATGEAKAMSETVFRLNAAHQRHADLARLAEQCSAQSGNEQAQAAAAIKNQNDDISGDGRGRAGFPELAAPHLVLASPAGIETTTAGSTHVASENHTAVTTGQDLAFAAGGSMFASVRQAIRMFVHKAGIRMIAAAGDIDVKALSNSINLLAKLDITHTAERITLSAKQELVINGGGSYARFNAGGIEQGTIGNFVVHAARHSLIDPKNMAMNEAVFPTGTLQGKGAFHLGSHAAAGGRPSAGMPYKLYKDGAVVEEGKFRDDGNMVFEHDLDTLANYELELANGNRYVIDSGEHADGHEVSAGIGYHGFENPGGSISDEHASLEKDRLLSNPAYRNRR
ncbi:hypothetical protein GCM10007387_15590 [Pseudoduganella albidiflava]|nr:hypothetical protein GCM10007387_15590 [Pseudoduganella albidiflava]